MVKLDNYILKCTKDNIFTIILISANKNKEVILIFTPQTLEWRSKTAVGSEAEQGARGGGGCSRSCNNKDQSENYRREK